MKLKQALKYKRKRYKGQHTEVMSYLYAPVSKIFFWIFINLKASANIVSFLMLALTGLGSILLFKYHTYYLGLVCMYIAQVWDYTDGDVARYTKKYSNLGIFFDGLHHTLQELFLVPAIGLFAANRLYFAGYSFYSIPFYLGILITLSFIVLQRVKFFVEQKLKIKDDREFRKGVMSLFYGEWIKLWIILGFILSLLQLELFLIIIISVWSILRIIAILLKLGLRCAE